MFKVHRSFDLVTGVKNNTIAVLNNVNEISVIYHETVVFKATNHLGLRIELENGGYDTISTRSVINRALEQFNEFRGVYLIRVKGKTMLSRNGRLTEFKGQETLYA